MTHGLKGSQEAIHWRLLPNRTDYRLPWIIHERLWALEVLGLMKEGEEACCGLRTS